MYNKVFISYAKEDYETAKKIYDFLLGRDYDVWLDKEKLLPGQDWNTEIMQNLKKSDFVILLLSNISVAKRGYVQREFKLALDYCEEKLDTDIYVIPCKIDNCEVPEKLCKYQWAELKDKNSFDLISNSLNIQRQKYEQIIRTKTIKKIDLEFDSEEKYSVSIDNNLPVEIISDPNKINVSIVNPAPIVILFGTQCSGKTMAIIRLTRYLEMNGYTVEPDRVFRSSHDKYYETVCDRFDEEVDSDKAAVAGGNFDFMLLHVYDEVGRMICQILDAPGGHYFDGKKNATFPSYINEIIYTENQKIWIFLVELNWGDMQTRLAYTKRIVKLRRVISPKDRIILMCNKVDIHYQFFNSGIPDVKSFCENIKNQYYHIFGNFKNRNSTTKLFSPYRFDFIVFSAGLFNKCTDNSLEYYCQSHDRYPATLWKAILKAIK